MKTLQLACLGSHEQNRVPRDVINVIIAGLLKCCLSACHLPDFRPHILHFLFEDRAVGPYVCRDNLISNLGLRIEPQRLGHRDRLLVQ